MTQQSSHADSQIMPLWFCDDLSMTFAGYGCHLGFLGDKKVP